ncbi:hypothetical protein GCM10025876_06900 [Demequina litorisediminis]|uniref:Uncharacterized protein n=1 Tax=Demequina litorisediminis TaxID=1849022 RepID=A0ABQ6IB65_9MICO|nr:hypothetical protein GCM10025876_06900 [Demequina litorisediminis]
MVLSSLDAKDVNRLDHVREDPESHRTARDEQRHRGGHEPERVTLFAPRHPGGDEGEELVQPDGTGQDDAGEQGDPEPKVERARHGVVVEAGIARLGDREDGLAQHVEDRVGKGVAHEPGDHERHRRTHSAVAGFPQVVGKRHGGTCGGGGGHEVARSS